MANKKKNNNLLIIGAIVLAFFIFQQGAVFKGAITGAESVVITAPTSVNSGASFNVNVEAVDVSGKWGASVTVNLDGCTINGNTELNLVIVSDLPNPLIYTATMISSTGCTISGDYAFGEEPIGQISTVEVLVCNPTYTCAANTCTGNTCSDGCGGTTPGTKSPVCTRPSNLCVESSTVLNGCKLTSGANGNCAGSWTVIKKTSVDADCTNSIDRGELGIAISGWIADTFSRSDLGIAIQSWAGA